MAFKSIQGSAKQSLLDYFVSGKAVQYHSSEKGFTQTLSGLTATGGVISDYIDGSNVYRAHIFTSSGTFDVTAPGEYGDTVEYLVVAGGGGGGAQNGGSFYSAAGGGGAGGFATNIPGYPAAGSAYPVSVGEYTVTIAAGGSGAPTSAPNVKGTTGGNSNFYPTPVSYPSPTYLRSIGGGGGGTTTSETPPFAAGIGGDGGSGGGASGRGPNAAGAATPNIDGTRQGYPGGLTATNNGGGAGGGGAGGAGVDNPSFAYGTPGGPGYPSSITGITTHYGGGGGGGTYPPGVTSSGGIGGGGSGGNGGPGGAGTYATGGGGGGATGNNPGYGGNGGSGIVVVRYQIGQLTATAKATGGAISYYNGQTIHTFTSSGTLTTNAGFNESVEYVVIGGGGAGNGGTGPGCGGGGGAGGYRTGTTPVTGPVSVQIGAGGAASNRAKVAGNDSYFGTPITSNGGGGAGIHVNFGDGGAEEDGGASPGNGSGGGGCDSAGAGGGSGAYGNPGGAGAGSGGTNSVSGGGGGGAGSSGGAAIDQGRGGYGGYGVQIPATFQNPASSIGVGPDPAKYNGPNVGDFWVAGGGGGGASAPPYGLNGLAGQGGGGLGFQNPTDNLVPIPSPRTVMDAVQNTGSGGGGFHGPAGGNIAGNGGSGIVLIAYPS